jgi:hypothetical protein
MKKCVVIGLQTTGEARSDGAAKLAGLDKNTGGEFGDEFVSAPNKDLKRIIMQLFPLPPKPKGIIAPGFLNPHSGEDGYRWVEMLIQILAPMHRAIRHPKALEVTFINAVEVKMQHPTIARKENARHDS